MRQDDALVITDPEAHQISQVAQAMRDCVQGEPGWIEELRTLSAVTGEDRIAKSAARIRILLPLDGEIRSFKGWIIVQGVREALRP